MLGYLILGSLVLAQVAHGDRSISDEAVRRVKNVDERTRNTGDYKATVILEQKDHGKPDTRFEAVVYRRDLENKLMILFLKPKTEAGKGYLRLDHNLFIYDPMVGKWDRRSERERIAGTGSRRIDFDHTRYADDFTVTPLGEDRLGAYEVIRVELVVKPGIDVAYPIVRLWIDKATDNVLKREEFGASRTLLRTTYYPKWEKRFSTSKRAELYYPREIRIFDEIEKGNDTIVVIKELALDALSANMFTKAWLESKSR